MNSKKDKSHAIEPQNNEFMDKTICPPGTIHYLVVFAASFGGINALINVLSNLKKNEHCAIIIVQHLKKTHEPTQLHKVLNRRSQTEVQLARNEQLLEPGAAYLAKPGKHLILRANRLIYTDGKPVNHVKPAADLLFISAAQAFGHKVIGVVLSGTGKDGTQGCLAIKEKGGMTIAQDRETSEFFDMPEHAIKAQAIDYVLPPEAIAAKISDLTDASSNTG